MRITQPTSWNLLWKATLSLCLVAWAGVVWADWYVAPGYDQVQCGGTAQTRRRALNFVSGATCADNSANSRTNVTITGGSGTPGGSNTQVQYNNSSAFGGITNLTSDGTNVTAFTTTGDPVLSTNIDLDFQPTTGNAFDIYAYGSQLNLVDRTAAVPIAVFYQTGVEFPVATLKLGVAKTTTATLVLKNSATGNNLILQPGATSRETTLILPTSDGTANQVLTTNGAGTLSWTSGGSGVTSITQGTGMSFSVTPITTTGTINLATPVSLANGGTNAALTADNGAVAYSDATKLALLASTATANKVLLSGASAAPVWSTPTFPNASATSGKYIKSDGTNWIASTGSASGVGTPTACSNQFVTGLTLSSDAAPTSTCTTATLASAQFVNQGTTTTLLHGNGAGNPSWSQVSLTADVTGNLPVGNLNSGTGATGGSSTTNATFWKGDGTWDIPVSNLFGATAGGQTASFDIAPFCTAIFCGRFPAPSTVVCGNMAVRIDTAPGAGKSWAITFRKDNVDTAITCTISGATSTKCTYTPGTKMQFTPANDMVYNVVASGAPANLGSFAASVSCAL